MPTRLTDKPSRDHPPGEPLGPDQGVIEEARRRQRWIARPAALCHEATLPCPTRRPRQAHRGISRQWSVPVSRLESTRPPARRTMPLACRGPREGHARVGSGRHRHTPVSRTDRRTRLPLLCQHRVLHPRLRPTSGGPARRCRSSTRHACGDTRTRAHPAGAQPLQRSRRPPARADDRQTRRPRMDRRGGRRTQRRGSTHPAPSPPQGDAPS